VIYTQGPIAELLLIATVCGGTHLPDITVITPVFHDGKIVFYVASRGHHADIGGISAGSLPPNSTELWQEGAAIDSVRLVRDGVFDEDIVREHLLIRPAQFPGCSGARNLSDNMADLRAQTGANQKGIQLIGQLLQEYGLETVLVRTEFLFTIKACSILTDAVLYESHSRECRGCCSETAQRDP
jgi:N-methylhydantoinase B/oxoprolinase/acetone carboxylase alpha subunit